MKEEIWKDVPDYEGLYQVSNLGRVKSLKKVIHDKIGDSNRTRVYEERILKPVKGTNNAKKKCYYGVTMCKDKKGKWTHIHVLVAMAFLGHKPKGNDLVVNHINENTIDNRLENLEVITQRENLEHSYGSFSSKHRGITFDIEKSKWRARYYCPIVKKNHHIGYYDTEEQAYFGRESWIDDYREYRERIESSWF